MDRKRMRKQQCRQQVSFFLVPCLARGDLPWTVIVGWMLAGLILLLGFAGAMSSAKDRGMQDSGRDTTLQAHPEWPQEILAAVATGIICAGMTSDMVRAAWGHPTRTSAEDGLNQHETWYYEGRPRAVERLGGQARHDAAVREWTVSFAGGRVIGWTD